MSTSRTVKRTASPFGARMRGPARSLRGALGVIGWPATGLLAAAAVVLGFVGFGGYYTALGMPRSDWDRFYLSLQLFVLESGSIPGPMPWQLEVARLLAPAVAAYAAAKAIYLMFRDRFDRLRVRHWRGHVVICGLGRKGLSLAESLRRRGDRVAVVEANADHDLIESARGQGVVVVIGDATHVDVLCRVRADTASHLVALCGNDGVNAQIAVEAARITAGRKGRPLSCTVHIVDPQLCRLLRLHEFAQCREGGLRVEFCNIYETGAQLMLSEYPIASQAPESERADAHVVVAGLGQFGEHVVVQAAHDWRARYGESAAPLHITILDRRADVLVDSLTARYPWLAQTCRLEARYVDFASPASCHVACLAPGEGRTGPAAVYVCLDDDSAGLSAALMLRSQLQDRTVPIVVRMGQGAGLGSLLRDDETTDGEFAGLRTFALLDRVCDPALLFAGSHERIARELHRDYLRQRRAHNDERDDDRSMVAWDDLPDDLKEANRDHAAHMGVKLQAVGCALAPLSHWSAEEFAFTSAEIERLAEMEHDRWMAERRREGWQLGDAKDAERKTTPYLVDWAELPEETRDCDREFVRGLPRFLARAHLEIVRVDRPPAE